MLAKCINVFWIALLAIAPLTANAASEVDPFANPPIPAFAGQTAANAPADPSSYTVEVLASGLNRPRALIALPDGNLLVADGKGDVRLVNRESGLSEPLSGMPEVRSVGGRGLMDITADYDFNNSRIVYMSFPAPPEGEAGGPVSAEQRTSIQRSGEIFQIDRIARARLANDNKSFEDIEFIAELPGRRLVSASDGTLYISTMGYVDLSAVQKLSTVDGKMLRINSDGSIPRDNPFAGRDNVRQEIYSWGHRDPDGAMIHPQSGELWTIEHGPMGGDELNRITPGNNYGWPNVTYGKNYDGSEIGPSARRSVEQPLYYWFPSLALSGLMMYTGDLFPDWQGDIFIGAMSPSQGKFLLRLEMDSERVIAEEHLLVSRDRRVRDVVQGVDGALYVLTDSEDDDALDRHFPGEVLRLTPR